MVPGRRRRLGPSSAGRGIDAFRIEDAGRQVVIAVDDGRRRRLEVGTSSACPRRRGLVRSCCCAAAGAAGSVAPEGDRGLARRRSSCWGCRGAHALQDRRVCIAAWWTGRERKDWHGRKLKPDGHARPWRRVRACVPVPLLRRPGNWNRWLGWPEEGVDDGLGQRNGQERWVCACVQ